MTQTTNRRPCGTYGATFHTRVSTLSTKAGQQRMRNRFAAPCTFCGLMVLPGAGCVEKTATGWNVMC